MKNFSILIVDDEAPQRSILSGWLKTKNFTVFESNSVDDALKIINEKIIDIVITDYKMPDKTGFDLLIAAKKIKPEIYIIIVTAFGTIEKAVESMKEGAFYYLTKPIDLDELEVIINRAKEQMILLSENKLLREQIKDKFSFTGLVSVSQKMEEVLNIASRIASSKASILIRGESGTGKEVIAKAIHFSSPRKDKPFVAISCASLNENLLESEMFGHEKGSFTGADKQKQGRFELADSGTLFLDEIGDLPLSTQIKLLRVLQESKFERVGGTQTLEVDVRILAATNRNIEQLIKEEKFREDLYYRLNVVTINVPALRDRREDILPLINNFLKKYSSETDKKDIKFSREAIDKLLKYSFPGNVRELENIVHHSIVLARDNIITTQDLPSNLMSQSTSIDFNSMEISLPEKVNALEISLVKSALEKTSGNQSAAARLLGISERNLRYKLEKWDMKKD